MKKMKRIILIITIALVAISCSDNGSDPSDNSGIYLMQNIGSYWVYEVKSNDPEAENGTVSDSVYLKSIEQKDGKEAYICDEYSDEDNDGIYESKSELETFYATSDGKLYLHKESFLSPQFGPGGFINIADQLEFKDDWIKIADENDDDWDIVESEVEFDLPFGEVNIKGDVNAEADNRNETKDFVIDGKTIKAKKFEVQMKFEGSGKSSLVPLPFPVTVESKTTYWIGEGVGPVQVEYSDLEITTSLPIELPTQFGSVSTLKHYHNSK